MGLALDKDFVFHMTCHACATRAADAGFSHFVMQKWTGHSGIENFMHPGRQPQKKSGR